MELHSLTRSLAAVLLIGAGALASAQIYDLHNDFAERANPHNNWSYGSAKTPTGFEPFTDNLQVKKLYESRGQNGLFGWSRPGTIFPYVGRNDGTSTLYQRWRPGDMLVCPSVDYMAIVRWTNPSRNALKVRLYLTFKRIEDVTSYESQWYVVSRGKIFDSGAMVTGNEEKSVTETLEVAPGGSIAIAVGCKAHMEGTGLGVRAVVEVKG